MSRDILDEDFSSDEDILEIRSPFIIETPTYSHDFSSKLKRRPLWSQENESNTSIFLQGFGRYKTLAPKSSKNRFPDVYVSPRKEKSFSKHRSKTSSSTILDISDPLVINSSNSSDNISIISVDSDNINTSKPNEIVDLTDSNKFQSKNGNHRREKLDFNSEKVDLTQPEASNFRFFDQFPTTISDDEITNKSRKKFESKKVFETEFPKTFESFHTKNKESSTEDEDDLVIISSSDQPTSLLTYWDINTTVDNMVHNTVLSDPDAVDNLTGKQVAKRLKNLYNTDFKDRMNDITNCLIRAKKKYKKSIEENLEVVPGIRTSDLQTLEPGEWLNDVIVNEYFKLLVQAKPEVCTLSSFFYDELIRNKTAMLPETWIKKKWIFIPLCLDNHWSLLSANLHEHNLVIYNSMTPTGAEKEAATIIMASLQNYYNEVKRLNTVWDFKYQKDLPRQENGYDCGVYVCMFARKILYQLSSNIPPENVTKFREWIKHELLSGKLTV